MKAISESGAMEVVSLDREFVLTRIAELLGLEDGELGVVWTAENFLYELPEKWSLSFALLVEGRVQGFAVSSRRSEGHAHLHRIVVSPQLRGKGGGGMLLAALLERVEHAGAKALELYVARENLGAQRFYRRLGFRVVREDTLNGLLMRKSIT